MYPSMEPDKYNLLSQYHCLINQSEIYLINDKCNLSSTFLSVLGISYYQHHF